MSESNYSPDPRIMPPIWHASREFGAGGGGYSGNANPDDEPGGGTPSDPIAESLMDGLIGYFALESDVSDLSTFDLTMLGDGNVTSFGPGKVNNCLLVTGGRFSSNASESDAHYNVAGDLEISAWIQIGDPGSDNGFFQSGDAYNLGYFGSTGFTLLMTALGGIVVTDPTVISADTWYFVQAWWERGVGLSISVNNAAATFQAETDTSLLSGFLADRTRIASWTETGVMTDGALDELGIWNRLLTQEERDWKWNSGAGRSLA